jgi:CubicO group peptidase (beta-lactamase class C family)
VGLARGDYAGVTEHLQAWLQHRIAADRVTGLSMALLDDQQPLWAAGFGQADKAAGQAATAQTRYRAGSISKVFTAAAVMQLADAGRLDIDAPLARYLPEFSLRQRDDTAGPITPRHLLTHHSGLPGDRIEGMWTRNPAHFGTLLDYLRDEYRAFPPDLVHAYSNIGFTLLGVLIERASGMDFHTYMQTRLLDPLRMGASAFASAAPAGDRAVAAYDEFGKPGEELPLRDTPAGGLNSTALDLLQLARLMFAEGIFEGEALLSPAAIRAMTTPQNEDCPLDADLRVGLGWHFAPDAVQGGGPVLFHNGGTLCHRAVLMLLPQHRLAVAVMANSANAMPTLMDAAGHALGLLLEAKSGIEPPPRQINKQDARYPPTALDSFPGSYDTPLGFVTIRNDAGQLRLHAGGQRLRLNPRADGYLRLEYRLLGLFSLDLGKLGDYAYTRAHIAGREVLLARNAGGWYLAGERLEPVPIPPVWRARLGVYEYVGGDALVTGLIGRTELKEDSGFLLVETTSKEGRQQLALAALDDDTAIVRGLGRGRGESVLVRRDGGRETVLHAGLAFRRQETR